MEKYDVVIIGGGLGSLTSAIYLSKRLRSIAVFETGKRKKILTYGKKITDSEKQKFDFQNYHKSIGGLTEGSLSYEYLKSCGIENEFDFVQDKETVLFDASRNELVRKNNFEKLKIDFVRRYPKERNNIYRLFDDIYRHYENYIEQNYNRLKNKEYTISSLRIEWGDLSLEQVLSSYIKSEELRNEFSYNFDCVGLPLNEINAYNYFIRWFDVYIEGSYFIRDSYRRVVSVFQSKLQNNKNLVFSKRKIEDYVIENDQIVKVIDSDGIEIVADYFIINERVDRFINTYDSENTKGIENFYNMYGNVDSKRLINTCYIGLTAPAEELGITEISYMFSEAKGDKIRLLTLCDCKKLCLKSCETDKGSLLLEFLDEGVSKLENEAKIIDTLTKYFPLLKGNISVMQIDTPRSYDSGMYRSGYFDDKTVNDWFPIEDYELLNPYKNSYFVGGFVKPEAGVNGVIQTGVDYGNLVEERIYYGSDMEYLVTNDELMNIFLHEFIPNSLGKKEITIQFIIGNDAYYMRTKGKNIRAYHGLLGNHDLVIMATNDSLYDLAVGNKSFEELNELGSIEYIDNIDCLENFLVAFNMNEVKDHKNDDFYVGTHHGLTFLVLNIAIWIFLLVASYRFDYMWTSLAATILFGTIIFDRYYQYKEYNVNDFISLFASISLFVVSIFMESFNTSRDNRYILLFLTLYYLLSWIIKTPISFGYVKYDYRTDFTKTKLFLTMCGGLTFIWAGTFLILLVLTVVTDNYYSQLGYYLCLFSFYLTYHYPSIYVKANFKN